MTNDARAAIQSGKFVWVGMTHWEMRLISTVSKACYLFQYARPPEYLGPETSGGRVVFSTPEFGASCAIEMSALS